MKIVALLCGLLASAFAWGAGIYLEDVGVQFLELWPETISQQFLGLVVWHALVAAAMVGGILTVLSPVSGALLLLVVGGAWAWLASQLPVGFAPQMIVPMALCGIGFLAALGAMMRGRARRQSRNREPSQEEIEREEALRLTPAEEPLPDFDFREGERDPDDGIAAAPAAPAIPPMPLPPARQDRPPGEISGLMAANVAALILLAVAVGILVFSELRSGDLFAAFSSSAARPTLVAEGAPRIPAGPATTEVADVPESAATAAEPAPEAEPTPVETPAPETAAPRTATATEVTADESATIEVAAGTDAPGTDGIPRLSEDDAAAAAPDAAAPSSRASATPASGTVASAGADVVAPVPAVAPEWPDPFSYCAAVGTVDFPDHRYAGPPVVDAIADVLRMPRSSSPDRVRWRCFEGAVVACASFDWPVCAMTPSVPEMLEFCAKNPNAKGLQAPNGNWSCDGTKPDIPAGENWPVDARGFLPAAWRAVPPPSEL